MKHALVTGASRGIGADIATRLLEHGYLVTTISRTETLVLRRLAKRWADRVNVVRTDLGDRTALGALCGTLRYGAPIDVLINNAAVAPSSLFLRTSIDDIEEAIAINLLAPLLLCRAVASQMVKRREGRIVNVSSVVTQRGMRGMAVYTATKAGLEGLTRVLALELGRRNITVNAVAPGYVDTSMTSALDSQTLRRIRRRQGLPIDVTAEDVSGTVLFLLSAAARAITGCVIPVDAGIHI